MSLILAIEADRRQATLLASIGRRVGAELVIAPTAERGLEAIGGRVPDLILTSALLSPRDDAAIAARLRDLDTAASHVQTLTIPVLAKASRRQAPGGGLLKKLRGSAGGSSATPAGCDPALFAEQVVEYLQRADAERATHKRTETVPHVEATAAPETSASDVQAEFMAADAAAPLIHDEAPAAVVHDEPAIAVKRAIEEAPIERSRAEARVEGMAPEPRIDQAIAEIPLRAGVDAEATDAQAESPVIVEASGADDVVSVAAEPTPDGLVHEPAIVVAEITPEPVAITPPIALVPDVEASIETPVAIEEVLEQDEPVVAPLELVRPEQPENLTELPSDQEDVLLAAAVDANPEILELSAAALDLEFEAVLREFENALDSDADPADATTASGASEKPGETAPTHFVLAQARPPQDAEPESAETGTGDPRAEEVWAELSRVLARLPEVEQPSAEAAPAPAAQQAATAAVEQPATEMTAEDTAAESNTAAKKQSKPSTTSQSPAAESPADESAEAAASRRPDAKRTGQRRKPAQDEWGLFDPEQCGFAALLEKLEEISDPADDAA